MSKPALVVIDVQNDYFEGGAFPLWNAEPTLAATEKAILGWLAPRTCRWSSCSTSPTSRRRSSTPTLKA